MLWDLFIDYVLYAMFYGSIAVAFLFLFVWFIDRGVEYEQYGTEITNQVGVERAQVMAGEEVVGHTVIRHRD